MGPPIRFRILGPVTAFGADGPIALGGPRRLALLAIFLLEPNRELPASRLVELLWNHTPPEGATNALQVHVAHLRRVLEGPARSDGTRSRLLVTRGSGYVFELARTQLDALVFEDRLASARRALAERRLEDAWADVREGLSLWHGPALADLAGEPFAVADTHRLEELRLDAWETWADAGLALGRHGELIADLERLALEHPRRERLTARLMLALYRCGRQADALGAYQRARSLLVEEHGIEPGPELQQLDTAVLDQRPELDWVPPEPSRALLRAVMRPAPGDSMRFAGRDAEMQLLRDFWSAASRGVGCGVLVAGEPGIGKTRLASELAREIAASGASVLWGRCSEELRAPYQPLVGALSPLVERLAPSDVSARLGPSGRALPSLLPILGEVPADEAATDRLAQFEAAASLMRAAATDAPILLVAEDLHWSDRASLLLLEHLVQATVSSAAMYLATFRDTDVAVDHPLADPDGALRRACRVVALDGLDATAVGTVLSAARGTASAELVKIVHDRTDGNPLFIGELLRDLDESGADLDVDAVHAALPRGVRTAIARRVARLPDATRRVLGCASLVGVEFDLEVVRLACGTDRDAYASALDDAIAARLIRTASDDASAMFTHALVAETIAAELGPARRAGWHRDIADVLDRSAGAVDRRAGELADHCARANEPRLTARAWRAAWDAGRYAHRRVAYEEAMRRYRQALSLLEAAGDGTTADRCDLSLELGEAAFQAGERAASKEAFTSSIELARALDDPDRLARVALDVSAWGVQDLWTEYGRVGSSTVALLELALERLPALDSTIRARLLTNLAQELYFAPDEPRREACAYDAVLMARRLNDPLTLAHALHGRIRTALGPDQIDERLDLARELLEAAERSGDRELRCVAHGRLVPSLWETGSFDLARHHRMLHAELAEQLRQPLHRIWARGMDAAAALMAGDFARVESMLAEANAISAEQFAAIQGFAGLLCVLRVEQGRAAEMVDVARIFVDEFAHVPAWRAGLAVLLAESGLKDEAYEEIDLVLAGGTDVVARDQNWMFCMAALAEAIAAIDDTDHAEPVASALRPFADRFVVLGDGYAVWCAVAKSLGLLARTAGDLVSAQRHLDGARRACTGRHQRALAHRVEAELGRVLLATGNEEQAEPLLARARRGADAIGQRSVVVTVDRLRANIAR